MKHRRKLAERPPAVFALGAKTAHPQGLAESRARLDRALAEVLEVEPCSIAVFGGVVDATKLRFLFNRMPVRGACDWDAIDEWADDVATTLEPSALVGRKS